MLYKLIEVQNVPVSLDPNKPAQMKQVLLAELEPFQHRLAPGSYFRYRKDWYKVLRVDFDNDERTVLIFISRNLTNTIAAGPDPNGNIQFIDITLHAQRWQQGHFPSIN